MIGFCACLLNYGTFIDLWYVQPTFYVTRMAPEWLEKTPLLFQNVRSSIHMSDRATSKPSKLPKTNSFIKTTFDAYWYAFDATSKYFLYLIAVDPLHLLPTWAGLWSSKVDGPGAFGLIGRSGGSCICFGCLGQAHCGLGHTTNETVVCMPRCSSMFGCRFEPPTINNPDQKPLNS